MELKEERPRGERCKNYTPAILQIPPSPASTFRLQMRLGKTIESDCRWCLAGLIGQCGIPRNWSRLSTSLSTIRLQLVAESAGSSQTWGTRDAELRQMWQRHALNVGNVFRRPDRGVDGEKCRRDDSSSSSYSSTSFSSSPLTISPPAYLQGVKCPARSASHSSNFHQRCLNHGFGLTPKVLSPWPTFPSA
jgi:hypothetical protein